MYCNNHSKEIRKIKNGQATNCYTFVDYLRWTELKENFEKCLIMTSYSFF